MGGAVVYVSILQPGPGNRCRERGYTPPPLRLYSNIEDTNIPGREGRFRTEKIHIACSPILELM